MRVRVCLPLLLFMLAPIPAWAGLIEATFSGSLTGGSAAGTPIAGRFIYDDLGSGACTPAMIPGCSRFVPIQSLELTLGDHRFTLADGFNWATGHENSGGSIFLPLYGGVWGPAFQIRTDRLFGGLTSFELHAGGQVGLSYDLIDGTTHVESAPFSVTAIPGPSSLIVSLGGAIVGLALRVRKRSRTSIA